jgi:hypothetical protein
MSHIQDILAKVKTTHPDDSARLEAIFEAPDGITVAKLIGEYYRDADRADRTPRELMYMHLGALGGVIERFIEFLQSSKLTQN